MLLKGISSLCSWTLSLFASHPSSRPSWVAPSHHMLLSALHPHHSPAGHRASLPELKPLNTGVKTNLSAMKSWPIACTMAHCRCSVNRNTLSWLPFGSKHAAVWVNGRVDLEFPSSALPQLQSSQTLTPTGLVLPPPATGSTPFKIPDYMLAMTTVQQINSKYTQRHEPCISSALGFVDLELREPEG